MTSPDRHVKVALEADTSKLDPKVKKSAEAFDNLAKSSDRARAANGRFVKSNADVASSVSKSAAAAQKSQASLGSLAKTGLGAFGVTAAVKAVVGQTADFERSLNTLKAVGGATAAQMAEAGKAARDLGNDTSLAGQSAGTAAQAMAELTKGGLSVDQSLKAARGTLQLATAAQIDGAQAATIQANALNTFSLGADKAGRVADLLANAANKSSGEIDDFAMALAQGGTVAAAAGISIDDTVTALAEFAQAGLKGSDAGTSLKTALLALQTPTDKQKEALQALGLTIYDAQGNFVGLEKLSGDLATAQKSMSQEAFNSAAGIAFGSDAVRAAQIFAKNGAEGWRDYSKAMAETGTAAKLAGVNTEGLPGALGELKNAGENLALTLGTKLSPVIAGTANALSGLLTLVAKVPVPVLAAVGAFAAISKFGPGLAASFRKGEDGVSKFGSKLKSLGKNLAGGAIFAGLGFAIDGLSDAFAEGAPRVADFTEVVDANTGALTANAHEALALALAQSGAFDRITKIGIATSTYTDAILGNVDAQKQIADALQQSASGATNLDDVKAFAEAQRQVAQDLNARALEQEHGRQVAEAAAQSTAAAAGAEERYVASLNLAHEAVVKANAGKATLIAAMSKEEAHAQNLTALHLQQAGASNLVAVANDGIAQSNDRIEKAQDKAKAAYERAKDALTPMGAAAERAADAQSKLDEATSRIVTRLDRLAGRVPTVEQAMADLNQATADFAKAAKNGDDGTNSFTGALIKANGEIDTANQAGRDLRTSLIGLRDKTVEAAKASFEQAGGMKNLTAATAASNKVVADARKAFVDAAVASGISTDAANKMADAYGLIPKDVSTTIKADDKEAQDKAKNVKEKLDALNKLVSKPTLDATDYATLKVAAVKEAIEGFHDKTVTLTIEQINLLQGAADEADRNQHLPPAAGTHATGGFITGPGTGTSDSILSRLSNGEFVVRASETAKHRPLLEMINQGALPGFASGGHVMVNMGADGLSGSNATQLWKAIYDQADRGAAATKAAQDAAKKAAEAIPAASSGVQQWAGIFTQALELTGQYSAANLAAGLFQMQTESGGNPAAINLWDINAQNGVPSKGLMQVIDPTFRSYAYPGYDSNIYDPLSNILASIRYTLAAYGSLQNGWRGVAYADGGSVSGPGGPFSDSILARVSAGEFIVNSRQASKHGALLRAINSGALPGFAAGGPVLPGAGALAGTPEAQRGAREGLVFQGDQALLQYLRDLGTAASDAAAKVKDSNATLKSAEDDLGKARDAQKHLSAKATDQEKRAAKAAVEEAQRRVTAAQRQADADKKVADAAKDLYDAQRNQITGFTRERAKLATSARQLDTITARHANTQGLLEQARADRASAIDSRASGFASIGGGALAFAGSRKTPTSFLAGLQDRLQKTQAYGKNLSILRGFGIKSGSLFNELASGSDDAIAQAALLARSGRGVVQRANRISLQTDAAARRAASVVESGRNSTIKHLEAAARAQQVAIHDITGQVNRISGQIERGLRGVLDDLADAQETAGAQR